MGSWSDARTRVEIREGNGNELGSKWTAEVEAGKALQGWEEGWRNDQEWVGLEDTETVMLEEEGCSLPHATQRLHGEAYRSLVPRRGCAASVVKRIR